MEKRKNLYERILIVLLKEPFLIHTITSFASALGSTRQGLWKTLKKLEQDEIVSLETIGKSKTSTYIIKLNWKNPLLEKIISFQLTKDTLKEERWKNNFAELEQYTKFLIIFGSILNASKEANDIDILAIVKNKNSFRMIDSITLKIQKTQSKKIHMIDLTEEEFANELKKQNKAYLDAIKKGIVLFGIDDYIKFIKSLKNER